MNLALQTALPRILLAAGAFLPVGGVMWVREPGFARRPAGLRGLSMSNLLLRYLLHQGYEGQEGFEAQVGRCRADKDLADCAGGCVPVFRECPKDGFELSYSRSC